MSYCRTDFTVEGPGHVINCALKVPSSAPGPGTPLVQDGACHWADSSAPPGCPSLARPCARMSTPSASPGRTCPHLSVPDQRGAFWQLKTNRWLNGSGEQCQAVGQLEVSPMLLDKK
ncbi:hypothetical protein AGIG_G6145 [Arapaima gigas]